MILAIIVAVVATNVVEPFGYKGHQDVVTEGLKPKYILNTLASVWRDQPSRLVTATRDDITEARRPLFREYFDLDPQDTQEIYVKRGKSYRLNPEGKNVVGRGVLEDFKREARGEHTGASAQVRDLLGNVRANSISGNYIPGQPDPWNFDLSEGEKKAYEGRHLPMDLFARSLAEAVGRPASLQTGGYYNPTPDEEMTPYLPIAQLIHALAGQY